MGSGSKVYAYSGLTFDLSNAGTFAKKKKKSERTSVAVDPARSTAMASARFNG